MIEHKDIVSGLLRVRAELVVAEDEGDYVCIALKGQLSYLFHDTPDRSPYVQAGDALEKIGVFAEVQHFLREEAHRNGRTGGGGSEIVAEEACRNASDYKDWQQAARATRIKLVDHLIGVYS